MDSNNKITNKWVLVYRDKPYFLIDRFYVDSEGVEIATSNIIEIFDSEDALNNRVLELESGILIIPDYSTTVVNLIREKYSIDDEIAIANNRMAAFDANLLPKEKEDEYKREYYAYQQYREECKKKAREICKIIK